MLINHSKNGQKMENWWYDQISIVQLVVGVSYVVVYIIILFFIPLQ